MRTLVHQAMEEGAAGCHHRPHLRADHLCQDAGADRAGEESARCGGIYSAHIRSEGDRLEEAVQETIDIAHASGAPAEIYHLKVAGKRNWGKLDARDRRRSTPRARRACASPRTCTLYTAGATGLDAAMPPWVQDGGLEAWIARLKDPAIRATRHRRRCATPHPSTGRICYAAAGAEGTLLLAFKNPALKPLTGKTLAEVAQMRGVSPEDTAIDLVIEDGTRVGVAYFLMSEDNVRREVALPWVSFGSDEDAPAPEGVFLMSSRAPAHLRELCAGARQVCPRGACHHTAGGDSQALRLPRSTSHSPIAAPQGGDSPTS